MKVVKTVNPICGQQGHHYVARERVFELLDYMAIEYEIARVNESEFSIKNEYAAAERALRSAQKRLRKL